MSIKITDENYNTYRTLFEVFYLHYSKLLPSELKIGPSALDVLKQFEARGKSLAKRGLQASLGDLVFMAQDLPISTLEAIDKDLRSKNLPDLRSFKETILETRGKVLKRGKIKNLDEYYIVQELISDMANDLSEEERQRFSIYIGKFENKAKNGG